MSEQQNPGAPSGQGPQGVPAGQYPQGVPAGQYPQGAPGEQYAQGQGAPVAEQYRTTTTTSLAPAAPPPAAAAPPPPAPPRANPRRLFLINGIGLLVLLLIALGLFYLWHQGYYFYSTDDATVSAPTAQIASPAPGTVQTVYHGLGSTVSQGNVVVALRGATGRTVNAVTPINGTVIQQSGVPGEVLPVGQPVAQVADLSRAYITAYVEETHINDVHTGQGVDVSVDAVKDTSFHGTVTRILPVSAASLSAIPSSDNASGNFTKVTQRIPVEITLDGYQGKVLYPGTSAEVTIHVHQ